MLTKVHYNTQIFFPGICLRSPQKQRQRQVFNHLLTIHKVYKLRLYEEYQMNLFTTSQQIGRLYWLSQGLLSFVRWEVFAIEQCLLGICYRLRVYPQTHIWTRHPYCGNHGVCHMIPPQVHYMVMCRIEL